MEVLVAIALIGMLTGSVFSFLWTLMGRRDLLHRRSVETQSMGAFLERLEADVLAGLAGDSAAGPGVAGTETSLKVLTRGVWLPAGRADRMAAARDLQASEYVFDRGSGVLRGRRWAVEDGGSSPALETISEHVQAMRLRYFDGKEWRGSFDSLSAGGLPVAIEVAVWMGEPTAGPSEPAAVTKGEEVRADRADAGGGARALDRSGPVLTGAPAEPRREPDRLRVIIVPDGPVSSWKEAR
jgi:hypothetical protein